MSDVAIARLEIEPQEFNARVHEHMHTIHPHGSDEFSREVYGFLGIPIDATSMSHVVRKIETAAASSTPLLISTANVNFLANSRRNSDFRESLIFSDICTADGMPIVWLSRLLGIPVKERLAGSDLFEHLKQKRISQPLKVFLFGGADGVAARAADRINAQKCGLICTGALNPGFGSVEELSADHIIDKINASKADILAVALSAPKANVWLQRNHHRLTIPVRAQLGATLDFQAGTNRRAPVGMQKSGLEWLWRIKEDPRLWRRYAADGIVLARLILAHVLPLLLLRPWHHVRRRRKNALKIVRSEQRNSIALAISGAATTPNFASAVAHLKYALAAGKNVVIDLAGTRQIDARFIGSLLVLQKRLCERQRHMQLSSVPAPLRLLLRLHGFTFLL